MSLRQKSLFPLEVSHFICMKASSPSRRRWLKVHEAMTQIKAPSEKVTRIDVRSSLFQFDSVERISQSTANLTSGHNSGVQIECAVASTAAT